MNTPLIIYRTTLTIFYVIFIFTAGMVYHDAFLKDEKKANRLIFVFLALLMTLGIILVINDVVFANLSKVGFWRTYFTYFLTIVSMANLKTQKK